MPTIRIGVPVAFFTPKHQWVLGKITAYDSKTKLCSCSSNDPVFLSIDNLPTNSEKLWIPQPEALNEDVNDLLNLTELHEASLLFCLKIRYMREVVYTNIGPIIVALNPFNYSIPWYNESKMNDYLAEDIIIENNLPHLWSTAHNTYWEMKTNKQNQTILISGESGAGKTEGAKIVLKYLGALSSKSGTSYDLESFLKVNKCVQAASPILESFGNAKTVRNDNSSRFGKFSKIQFDINGLLVGCHVTKYLLEKSRIISAASGERVYHSYYQLAQGPLAKEFSLRNPKVYRILNSGGCININDVDDSIEYLATKKAMNDVGITEEEQLSIWRIVAGVLFLQNTGFIESEERAGRVAKIDSNLLPVLGRACELWGINEEEFKKELISTHIITKKEQTVKYLNKVKALDTRDSVCKSLYNWLFDWLVLKINNTTNREEITTNWIGLLDIFGFENFQKNSFEQLCINLTNEVLQGHYNQHIFTLDIRECQEEGIDTTLVNFSDNKECIELLMGKVGIFTLLDEECAVSGNESNYLQKLIQKFGPIKSKGGSDYFLQATVRSLDNNFIIKHYAADVQYCVDGFLDKNRDALKESMRQIFLKSKLNLIPTIIPKEESKTSSKVTVGSFFIKQLGELMSVINTTNPHWIRCIKPNTNKQPRDFSNILVMQQLRSAGVLETIKIRKAGFPIRFKYTELIKRYRVLCNTKMNEKESCQQILKYCNISNLQAQLGKAKVFMKHEAFYKLNHTREQAIIKFILIIQSFGRGNIVRGKLFTDYIILNRHRIMEEKLIREKEIKRQLELEQNRKIAEALERQCRENVLKEKQYKAAVIIQKLFRGILNRKRFLIIYLSILQAREEHTCDDELQKYRIYEFNLNKKIRSLESRVNEQRESKQDFSSKHRIELLRERRENTMRLLREKKFIIDARREEEIAHEQFLRAKEVMNNNNNNNKHIQKIKKAQFEEKQLKDTVFPNNMEKHFIKEMLTKLRDNGINSENNKLHTTLKMKMPSHIKNSVFSKVQNNWEKEERWIDEREKMIGAFHKVHALTLTPQQRRLEGHYRVKTISKVLWQSESKKTANLFKEQRSNNNNNNNNNDANHRIG